MWITHLFHSPSTSCSSCKLDSAELLPTQVMWPDIRMSQSALKNAQMIIFNKSMGLGKPWCSIIDEFLEKFQTAFGPPPRAFFGKNVAIFCYKNFWNGNDPPKLASQMLKILQRNFLDRKWPPPSLIGVTNKRKTNTSLKVFFQGQFCRHPFLDTSP